MTGVNLEGLAIGNGEFSAIKDLASAVTLTYMRGMHSKELVFEAYNSIMRSFVVYSANLNNIKFSSSEVIDIVTRIIHHLLTCSQYESLAKCVPDDFDGPMSTFDFTQ